MIVMMELFILIAVLTFVSTVVANATLPKPILRTNFEESIIDLDAPNEDNPDGAGKLDPVAKLTQQNKDFQEKLEKIEDKLRYLDKETRKNNLIFYGIKENQVTQGELYQTIKDMIEDMNIEVDKKEIANVYRIGQKSAKARPVMTTFTTSWKRNWILNNRQRLPKHIIVNEDFPKEVLEIRKKLKPLLMEERKKGNFAYIKYDQLIVQPRKRLRQKYLQRSKRKHRKSKRRNREAYQTFIKRRHNKNRKSNAID